MHHTIKRPSKTIFLLSIVYALNLALFVTGSAKADAYIPAHDDIVLEVLPKSWNNAKTSTTYQLRQAWLNAPSNATIATRLARHYIDNAKQSGDTRFYGYAERALNPWKHEQTAPPQVLLLRATINQQFHQFEQALNDLDHLLKMHPNNEQAWLTRAGILQVMGYPLEAAKSCLLLARLTTPLVATSCLSRAVSTTGLAEKAYSQLLATYRNTRPPAINQQVWALTILADIAHRLGDINNAQKHYSDALALSPENTLLIAYYSDFLIEQKNFNAAYQLLHNKINRNGLLLRLVITEKALKHPDYIMHKNRLNSLFEEETQWGTYTSLRDQSRFHLTILNNPHKALTFATRNWQQQKELTDIKLLLQAAIAANKPAASIKAIQWAQQHQIKDKQLNHLIALIQNTP